MKVEQLMTRNPKTCGPDEPLEAAARLMWDHDVGCVPVVDKGQVVGMITDRDVCMAAYIEGARLNTVPVSRAMSTTVRSCKAGEPKRASPISSFTATQYSHPFPIVSGRGAERHR